MCWYGENNRKIAKEDIKVFKIVKGNKKSSSFNSIYYHFIYKLGLVYSSRIKKGPVLFDSIRIRNGIHSYSSDCKVIVVEDLISIQNRINNENLDIFSKHTLSSQQEFYVLDCIIPKRSSYYINDRGEVVSSRLKIIKAIRL